MELSYYDSWGDHNIGCTHYISSNNEADVTKSYTYCINDVRSSNSPFFATLNTGEIYSPLFNGAPLPLQLNNEWDNSNRRKELHVNIREDLGWIVVRDTDYFNAAVNPSLGIYVTIDGGGVINPSTRDMYFSVYDYSDVTQTDLRNMVEYIHAHYLYDYTHYQNSVDWEVASVTMMYVHAYEVLGDKKYLNYANEALWVCYNISDDQCWGANAALELCKHGITPNPETWHSIPVETNYTDIFNKTLCVRPGKSSYPFSGFASPEGGIYWGWAYNTYNSCTFGQAIILAYRMYGKDQNSVAKTKAYNWLRNFQVNKLLNTNTGEVIDTYHINGGQQDRGFYTYNFGTVLGAFGLSSKYDPPYSGEWAQYTCKIAQFTENNLTGNIGVLYNNQQNNNDYFGNPNVRAFNGIFMHFIPYYCFSPLNDAEGKQAIANIIDLFRNSLY